MLNLVVENAEGGAELYPDEDTSREYRAIRGKRGIRSHAPYVLFVPNQGTHMRDMARADLRLQDSAFCGNEIILEFSTMTIVLRGKHLAEVAAGFRAGWVVSVEAFNPATRDAPKAGDPLIETMTFHPARALSAKPAKGK